MMFNYIATVLTIIMITFLVIGLCCIVGVLLILVDIKREYREKKQEEKQRELWY